MLLIQPSKMHAMLGVCLKMTRNTIYDIIKTSFLDPEAIFDHFLLTKSSPEKVWEKTWVFLAEDIEQSKKQHYNRLHYQLVYFYNITGFHISTYCRTHFK